jgi:EAL domain-containing protein (putative c-di-GMP-specific phosphodiesterase class I)
LLAALDEDRVQLFFQPKVSFKTRAVSGAEALLRWSDDELGYVQPLEILEAAETMDQLSSLDAWVFDRACRHLMDWKERGIDLGSLSINISGATLAQPDFVDWVVDRISRFDLAPGMIDFEILESAILFDMQNTIDKISACQEIGFTFSLDDFGTGQSSLSHLARLPVNYLKIDKSFVDGVVHDRARGAMTYQIVEIGHSLGISVVAEGVENIGQYLIIRSFGCDAVQGFYCARPMPEAEFIDLMTQGNGIIEPVGIEKL